MAETLSGLGFTLIGGRARLDLDKAPLIRQIETLAPSAERQPS
jgi:hypothetical protein